MERFRKIMGRTERVSTSSTNPSRETSAFHQSLYRPDVSSQPRMEQQASQFRRRDVRSRSSAQELQMLNHDIHQHMTSPLPGRSLDYFKQTEQLIDRMQIIYSDIPDSKQREQREISAAFNAIQEHRMQTSDTLFKRDYLHERSGNELMIHVETNDKGHTHPFPAYTMDAMPSRGMMVLGQAYHERINDPDKVLPYTVILRNQWKEATQNQPKQYPLRMIRSNNVTNQEAVRVAKECIRGLPTTGDGGVELEKGSDGFQRILATKVGRSKQRLLEQNPDVFGKKEVKKIIVDDDGTNNTLQGLRFMVGDRDSG